MISVHWRIPVQKMFLVVLILPGLFLPQNVKLLSRSEAERVTTILVVDNSGSMEASDPGNLRCTAVQMFISLLDDEDAVGVVQFSTESRQVTHGVVSLASNRDELLNKIQSCPSDGYTDMKVALESVRQMLSHSGTLENHPSVILLTDGKPEIQNPYAGYEQDVLDLAISLNVPIYAIALTSAADLNFLSRLAVGTDGYVIPANEATDLLDAYLQVLGAIKDRTVIGDGNADSPGKTQIEIDPALAPYVEKVSFIVSSPENITARLVAPDGHTIIPNDPQVTFANLRDSRFMVMTIAHPTGGVWEFELEGNGSVMVRAILYSRLRTQIISPIGFQKAGEPIPIIVRLVEERENNQTIQIIGEASFSAEITLPDGTLASLDRFYDDGTHGDLIAGDGDFTRLYVGTSQIGAYYIAVNGWKGAVPVEQKIEVRIVQFPVLVIDAPRGEFEIRDQSLLFQAHFAGGDPPTLDGGDVVAHLKAPSGEVKEIKLKNLNGNYSTEFLPLENGNYTLQIETRDATYLGAKYWDAAQIEFTTRVVRELMVGQVDANVLAGCFQSNIKVAFRLPITSLREEKISLALDGFPGFLLQPAEVEIQPGEQQLELMLLPSNGKLFTTGEYNGKVRLTGSDDLLISPAQTIPLSFSIPSLWSRCRKPISWWFLIVTVLAVGGIRTIRRIRISAAAPLVTGSLRYWEMSAESAGAHEIDLTAFHKTVITLGSGTDCDLMVKTGDLEDQHADFRAWKDADNIQIYLQPIGTVKKSYNILRNPVPLTHGDIFSMGRLNFQYLSDSGE